MQEDEERIFFHSLYENKIMNNVGVVDFLLTAIASTAASSTKWVL